MFCRILYLAEDQQWRSPLCAGVRIASAGIFARLRLDGAHCTERRGAASARRPLGEILLSVAIWSGGPSLASLAFSSLPSPSGITGGCCCGLDPGLHHWEYYKRGKLRWTIFDINLLILYFCPSNEGISLNSPNPWHQLPTSCDHLVLKHIIDTLKEWKETGAQKHIYSWQNYIYTVSSNMMLWANNKVVLHL